MIKKYIAPSIEVCEFDNEDIITESAVSDKFLKGNDVTHAGSKTVDEDFFKYGE